MAERNSSGWRNRESKRPGWRSTTVEEEERLTVEVAAGEEEERLPVEEAAGEEKRRASTLVEEGYLCNNS